MAVTYCSSCGFKIEFTALKPKFCSSCGESLIQGFSKTPAKTVVAQDEFVELSSIKKPKLGVDIIIGQIEGPKKFEDVIKERPLGISERVALAANKSIRDEMRDLCKPSAPIIVEEGRE